MVARLLVGMLFLVGLWGVVAKRNLVKKVFGLSILNSAVVLLFVMEGSRSGTAAPIMDAAFPYPGRTGTHRDNDRKGTRRTSWEDSSSRRNIP